MVSCYMTKFATCIGSRRVPTEVKDQFYNYCIDVFNLGFGLRSGGAPGCDHLAEVCYETKNETADKPREMEIFLPWKGFNGNKREFQPIPPEAFVLAEKFHSKWYLLNYPVKCLMARNIQQVLGKDLLSPSEFIICWNDGGFTHGGTSQAMRCARAFNIPVYNIYDEKSRMSLNNMLEFLHLMEDPEFENAI